MWQQQITTVLSRNAAWCVYHLLLLDAISPGAWEDLQMDKPKANLLIINHDYNH